ncbi:hypothetical protein [Massilia sp. YIM B02443]|uniref:hypothetical protein n=1 Tax=Massilia sp. YIM B02443 TaxID=3050127 RepID=UPI0025B64861|nr:hypothetical protein [Massilia sp. YIM B02443]MDN4038055.1 hypothetical protein [Massilia sp. YIM B02443]
MSTSLNTLVVRTLSATLCGTILVACGGGSGDAATGNTLSSSAASVSASGTVTTDAAGVAATDAVTNASMGTTASSIYSGRGASGQTPATGVKSPVAAAPARTITNVRLENGAAAAQTSVPFTFGQVFAAGDLAKDTALVGRFDNGETLPLQVDAKAFHPDGTVRHAIISGVIPTIAASQTRKMDLVTAGKASTSTGVTTASLLNSGFNASVSATLNGVRYSASADELIKAGKTSSWLAGASVNEWLVSAPLKTAGGVQHPHLTARFAVRWYDAAKKARVDVTVENNWAYEPAPSNFTYDAEVLVGGKSVYTLPALTHLHHARWRKVFWQGNAAPDAINVKHDAAYLISTGAVANYDQSITVKESTLANLKNGWTGEKTTPMHVGSAMRYMPTTGGREDIGLLPAWSVLYLLSMDARAKMVTLGNGDLAGSWSMHYRDKTTDQPISIIDFPYMTLLGRQGDTLNPTTKKYEWFPSCATSGGCATPFTHDTSHQPNLAYLPYLVTGDYYYLEELQFWASHNVLQYNPRYREYAKGILQSNQVRGQAWTLRSIAEAAYITPDSDRLKSHFTGFVNNNLAWYNSTYTDNAQANKLGVLTNQAFAYREGTGIAPWQDDFFTQSVGHAADLGFTEAKRLLTWKAKFPVQRMTDNGLCWIDGAIYSLAIKATSSGPLFTTLKDAANQTQSQALRSLACGSAEMGKLLGLKVGEMTGYSSSAMGYPSNMQPALAYAVTASGAAGKAAWDKFMARSVKPDYSGAPQFAIVPR